MLQGDGIMDDASLMEIGILDSDHRNRLVQSAMMLSTPLDKMDRPSTVEEWLDLLRLGHYAEQFRKNLFEDMERVRRVWEVELTTLVEIRLVGHLRRMLVSLDESNKQNAKAKTRSNLGIMVSHVRYKLSHFYLHAII